MKNLLSITSLAVMLAWPILAAAQGNDSMANSGAKSTTTTDSNALNLPLGPLKMTLSPQGASLTGDINADMWHPEWGKTTCGSHQEYSGECGDFFTAITFNTDSSIATSSTDSSKNHASISFSPTIYYDLRSKTAATPVSALPINQQQARQQAQNDCAAALNNVTDSSANASIDATNDACVKYHQIEHQLLPRYTDVLSLSVSPDAQYRYGHIDVSGTTYSADQLVLGGSAHLFMPILETWIPTQNQFFVTWPYASAGYYSVKNYNSSTIPVPTGIQDHYLDVEEHVEIYIPYFEKITGINAIALADIAESLPTSGGSGQGWQVARTYQLSFQTKGTWNFQPAVTYQSGKDKGLTYDRQVLIGVLLPLF